MIPYSIVIKPFGEHAILVEWPKKVEETILDDILQFSEYLKSNYLAADDWELITAYNSLTIINKKELIKQEEFSLLVKKWYSEKEKIVLSEKFLWRLPVCYDTDFGIDLLHVSKVSGISISEIISLHTKEAYTVYGIGFLPGFMYLGGLPKTLEVARKETPRLKVSKGAVGLAGKQTGIYPQESPGGWNIIGNCPIPIFDVSKESPCFVSVGDKIQFYEISKASYDLHTIESEVGIYKIEKQKINA